MNKEEVLADYLSDIIYTISEDDVFYEGGNSYKCEGKSYIVLTEFEADEYFFELTNEIDEEDKHALRQAGFEYLIDYIHFDERYEGSNLVDYGFTEVNYKNATYFISEE